ncbi:hypothetical protein QBC47DRAFT_465489 [Echria macrotheca]|uniref:F-box domain-containing protein n=1 Tax=Echria macrotheca TaxID=438768 RepID=A0AAJ0F5W3_9PEZI|nr:hypothetical protein QBC47DRAFT_465489 [Echria macrotheca]
MGLHLLDLPEELLLAVMQLLDPTTIQCLRRTGRIFLRLFSGVLESLVPSSSTQLSEPSTKKSPCSLRISLASRHPKLNGDNDPNGDGVTMKNVDDEAAQGSKMTTPETEYGFDSDMRDAMSVVGKKPNTFKVSIKDRPPFMFAKWSRSQQETMALFILAN